MGRSGLQLRAWMTSEISVASLRQNKSICGGQQRAAQLRPAALPDQRKGGGSQAREPAEWHCAGSCGRWCWLCDAEAKAELLGEQGSRHWPEVYQVGVNDHHRAVHFDYLFGS